LLGFYPLGVWLYFEGAALSDTSTKKRGPRVQSYQVSDSWGAFFLLRLGITDYTDYADDGQAFRRFVWLFGRWVMVLDEQGF
jgi:hypothetical protein